MFKCAQDANAISASKVARSLSKKMKALTCFSISVILSYIPKTINFSPIGGPGKRPSVFKTFRIMPITWLLIVKVACETSLDNLRPLPPYTRCIFLSACSRPRSIAA